MRSDRFEQCTVQYGTCSAEFHGDLLTGGIAGKLARALLHILGRAGGFKEGATSGLGLLHLPPGQQPGQLGPSRLRPLQLGRLQLGPFLLLGPGQVTLAHLLLLALAGCWRCRLTPLC